MCLQELHLLVIFDGLVISIRSSVPDFFASLECFPAVVPAFDNPDCSISRQKHHIMYSESGILE